MDIAAKRDALIAAIHREESQKIIAELTVTLGRLHGNEAEEYSVNQWWFKELLKAADQQGAPLDLKRAVIGVVPKMIESLSAQPEQAKPARIEGKLREFCGPEDFGVPTQYAKCAHNYAMWLAAQQQAKPTAIAHPELTPMFLLNVALCIENHDLVATSMKREILAKLHRISDELQAERMSHLTAPHGESDKTEKEQA